MALVTRSADRRLPQPGQLFRARFLDRRRSAARSGESFQPETGGGYLFGQSGHGVVAAAAAFVYESEPGQFHSVFVLPGELSIVTRLVGGSLSA